MTEILLSEYVQKQGQLAAATILKLSQGSISKMLKKKRDVRLVFDLHDKFSHAYEVKPLVVIDNSAAEETKAA